MKKLTNEDNPYVNSGNTLPLILGFIFIIILIATSCTRKVHTEKTQTSSSDTQAHYIDSVNQVNRTLSEAYEELLKTTNSTGVVFERDPCDTVYKVAGSTMPRVINKVTVSPDGTKTFEGNIKSYKDDATKYQRTIFSMQETIDSLNSLVKKDASHHEQSAVVVVRSVKTVSLPWYLIAGGILFFILWINERFSLFKIPFITRTSLFTKKQTI